jgi:hypothetical protein
MMTTKATVIKKSNFVFIDGNWIGKNVDLLPVIRVMPPRTAAAPTMAYSPGVMQSSPPAEHSP